MKPEEKVQEARIRLLGEEHPDMLRRMINPSRTEIREQNFFENVSISARVVMCPAVAIRIALCNLRDEKPWLA